MRCSFAFSAAFWWTFATLATALCAQAAQPKSGYRIICHPSNPMTAADRDFVEDVFLKKVSVWPTGEVARPVDLIPSSQVRRQFSDDVLGRPLDAVRNYWQQRIFSGADIPPPELKSDDDVVRYVLNEPGALGYVSATAALKGAKILTIK